MTTENPNKSDVPIDLPTPKRSWKQRLAALTVILLILAVGAGIAITLIKTKPTAKKKSPPKMQALVDTITVSPISTSVTIEAAGRMVPSRQITLQARVAGTVKSLHPQFIPGGILHQGEVIATLDDTDYRLELVRKQNILQQALADLRLEEGNQAIASQEWELIKRRTNDLDTSSVDLALRKPHLEKVQAAVASAKTDVERVQVDLERTVIKAPFNAAVMTKSVDLGSQVGSQSQLATLVGIDTFWAEVTVPKDKLAWFDLPGVKHPGSPVRVYADDYAPRPGKIIKLLPDVEQLGLMAKLLIEVNDPMKAGANQSPLLLGSFVNAKIEGKKLKDVFALPRAALKDDKSVLLVTAENTLRIQPVSVLWKNNEQVYIDSGLQSGDQIIVSQVAAPLEGMPLIINGPDNKTDNGQKASQGKGHE
ncbi:MAG: efflux RND transporter periplasmic adaptor subunit [Desulfobulbaceae bacterium]|nr:efflux RND transporter periplasmic adaptor subunit [Desulfobulbaceae bacterium]